MSKIERDKDFVPYNQALELKQLGFDEDCFGYYDTEGLQIKYDVSNPTNKNSLFTEHSITNNPKVSATTFSKAFRFFHEKYDLHNGIYPYYDGYEFQIKDFRLPTNAPINGGLMKYEEAELSCLCRLIEMAHHELYSKTKQ